ncbi:site-specific integrase [Pontibacillus sp. HMF3514]|uniref:tyrosine-type recombinase/integrase n=1 Tax=Pontibacillus sp. HMF3514 TaxID=2692425 RepID=UPI00131F9862|nr:site-specific integrase [Pontibacillus sp. HMF3514]QHE52797.1 tyrosine-type recombinase/integrase [Pontibacillus sp. HMF3514]
MEITIKELPHSGIKMNKNLAICVDGETYILKSYPLMKLGSVENDKESIICLVRSVHKALVDKDLKTFREINVKHKSISLKLSIHFWHDKLLELVRFYFESKYPKELPTMGDAINSNKMFGSKSKEIHHIWADIRKIVDELTLSWLKKAIDDFNVPEIKRLQSRLSFLGYSNMQFSDEKALELIKKLAEEDIESFIEPDPHSLHRRLFPKREFTSEAYKHERYLCDCVALEVKPLYISKMKSLKIDFKSDVWTSYIEKETGQFKIVNIYFEDLFEPLKSEIKDYIKYLVVEEGYELISLQSTVNYIKIFVTHLQKTSNASVKNEKVNIFQGISEDISKIRYTPHLLLFKADLEEHYKIGTISRSYGAMARFFTWYTKKHNKKVPNPFHLVGFKNANLDVKHIEAIPEEIVEIINDNLKRLSPMHQNAWIILMNTGMRASDLINLKCDGLYWNEKNEQWQLKYIPIKQEKEKRIKQEDIYHEVYATPALRAAFNSQLQATEEIRKASGFETLFIHKFNGIKIMARDSLSYAVNRILTQIGVDFRFSNHMCRKSLIVTLLTEGLSVEEISKVTGNTPETILHSYFGLEEKKIAEMETAFFDEAFTHLFKPKFGDSLSEQELEAIRMEIKRGSRKAPDGNGYCGKHVVFGPCIKSRCIGCRMLVTAPEQIPHYRELLAEHENYISNLEKQFDLMGIKKKEYLTYRDFQSELDYLELIKDGLNQLIKFVEEKIPEHEHKKYLN